MIYGFTVVTFSSSHEGSPFYESLMEGVSIHYLFSTPHELSEQIQVESIFHASEHISHNSLGASPGKLPQHPMRPLIQSVHSPYAFTHPVRSLTQCVHSPSSFTHLVRPLTQCAHSPSVFTHPVRSLTQCAHSPSVFTHPVHPLT